MSDEPVITPENLGEHMVVEWVPIGLLKPHPRNYRKHPEDQIKHLEHSLREQGWYRNVVTAEDYTILAGHGITRAAQNLSLTEVPIVRLPISQDSPEALKLLVADNELVRFAEADDRVLAEILKEIATPDPARLLGTGWDMMKLTNFAFVTRAEIKEIDHAAEWAGMPEFDSGKKAVLMTISFPSEEARELFAKNAGVAIVKRQGMVWSATWPPEPKLAEMPVKLSVQQTSQSRRWKTLLTAMRTSGC